MIRGDMRLPYLPLGPVALLLFGASCGESDAGGAPTAPPAQGSREAPVSAAPAALGETTQRGLAATFALPRFLAGNLYASRSMLAEAVYFASSASGSAQLGQVTATGTISVTQAGAQYAPAPADKLVVRLGAETHEFEVRTAQGNNQAESALSWLLAPHVLAYTHRLPGQAEAAIDVRFDGQRFEVKSKGWANLAGQRWEVELAAAGTTGGTRDFDGQDTETLYELSGVVRGGGAEIAVKEVHRLHLVASNSLRLLTSQRGSATSIDSVIRSTLECEGRKYEFADVTVQTHAKDKGGQASSGIAGLSGGILRDGQPFATCTLQDGVPLAATSGGVIPLAGN